MNGVRAFLGALLLLLPQAVAAQVVISEIMYDLQTGSDTGREWIEVFNAGSNSIRLVDWRLYEANTNHAITAFAGGDELPSGGYAVIADSPAKFMEDWPSYTGALFDSAFSLSNGGETIGIHTPSPEFRETDLVSFQSAWGANGDGKTLQRTSSDNAVFSAASPTPGSGTLALIPGLSYTAPAADSIDTGSAASSTSITNPTPSYVPPPLPQLFADAGASRIVIVGADTEFDGRAYDRDDQLVDKVRYLWNFGDGSIAEGPAVLHHFDYPGRYAVILTAAADKESMIDQIIVTAEPAQLSFTVNADGSVTIANKAGRDLDLSGWIVRSFLQTFTLPEHSIILAGESIRISKQTLTFIAGLQTELEYPNGAVALHANESSEARAVSTPAISSAAPSRIPISPVSSQYTPPARVPVVTVQRAEASETEAPEANATAAVQAAAAAAAAPPRISYWWAALLVLAALGAGVFAYIRRIKAGEWDIEEA